MSSARLVAAAQHRTRTPGRLGHRGVVGVELDRACCTGAGVIAEHSQELADTLNGRTFALAQQEMANGADLMMNICSTCQGAQSESQERLDGNAQEIIRESRRAWRWHLL